MSLGINTTTPEGIVLAADSRQSYRNMKGMSRIGSDSATKIFKIGDRMGVIVTGLAFLPDNGVVKNISRFIEEFTDTLVAPSMTVAETSDKLKSFFEKKYDYKEQLKALPTTIKANLDRQGLKLLDIKIEKDHVKFQFEGSDGVARDGVGGVDQLQFIVAGFDKDNSHHVNMVYVPGENEEKRNSSKRGQEYGASWIGQSDVVTRIVLGFDSRIQNLPFIQKLAQAQSGPQVLKEQLAQLEYLIQWGTMTLQDGIDFSVLAIETTKAMQRFSDGIQGDPGDIPGVGGPVDVAVITPEGFRWVTKKTVGIGSQKINLHDKIPA